MERWDYEMAWADRRRAQVGPTKMGCVHYCLWENISLEMVSYCDNHFSYLYSEDGIVVQLHLGGADIDEYLMWASFIEGNVKLRGH